MSKTPRTATTDWQWRRREVIIRDDYECQECGALGGRKGETPLHVHHTDPVSNGGSDGRDNLVTLCDDCHAGKHSKPDAPTSAECPSPGMETYNQRNDETGQFDATYSEDEFLDALEQGDDGTTSEVAEIVGCAYRTAYEYLTQLESDGRVRRRKLGSTSVWEIEDEGDE